MVVLRIMNSSLTPKIRRRESELLENPIRPNGTPIRVSAIPEVDLVFRGHPNMVAFEKQREIEFLDPEDVGNEELTKIHKTQSSVPSSTCKTGS